MSEQQKARSLASPHNQERYLLTETNETVASRPVGVLLIAGLCFFAALLVSVNVFFNVLEPDGISGILTRGPLGFGISLLLAAFFVATGVGLWRFREWGRYCAVAFVATSIVTSGIDSFARYPAQTALMLTFIRSLLPIALLLYLLHPSIRPAFRRRSTV
jgi:hypothetical protein